MKYLKKFNEGLTEQDEHDIVDAFFLEIADEYHMVEVDDMMDFIEAREELPCPSLYSITINTIFPYRSFEEPKCNNHLFENIIISIFFIYENGIPDKQDFQESLKKFESRINRFGFIIAKNKGKWVSAGTGGLSYQGTSQTFPFTNPFDIVIYKPMINESEEIDEDISNFNPDDYLDYLLSEMDRVTESDNDTIEKTDNLVYFELDIDSSEASRIENSFRANMRFKDVITICKYDFDTNIFRILIIDRFFYGRNQKWLYRNIQWEKHPLLVELEKSSNPKANLGPLLSRYKNAQAALGLPEGISMIKNLGRIGVVEFWPQNDYGDPIDIWEDDLPKIQFYLFKYLGK